MTDELNQPVNTGFSETTTAIICFVPILGVLPAIAFLLLNRDRIVKWYALQSLLLWITVIIANTFLQTSIFAAGLIPLVNIIGLIVIPLIVAIKIHQKEKVRLPGLAELADRFLHD